MSFSLLTLVIVGVYFLALAAVSLLPSRVLPGDLVFFFRALFPSWKLFDRPEGKPRLFFRLALSESAFGEWEDALPPLSFKFRNLFLNPDGNLHLAVESSLQLLFAQLSSSASIESTVPYQLAKNLVELRLRESERAKSSFQFKICAGAEDVVLSPTYSGRKT